MCAAIPISKAVIDFLEDFPISIRMLTPSGRIEYMNKEMRDTFGNLIGEDQGIIFGEKSILKTDTKGYEVILADVHYRVTIAKLTGDDGVDRKVEFFEDFSEISSVKDNLVTALTKVKAETTVARAIQQSILPIDDEYWNTLKYHSIYLPADDLGGDFYDLVYISEEEILMYVADVSGHGIQASLLTIFIREQVRSNIAAAETGLDELLRKILKNFCDLDIDPMLYVTILLCKYNKVRNELSIANAGHNCYPITVRNGSRVEAVPVKGMPISAISDGDSFEEELIVFKKGDKIILYTDGLIEEYSPVLKGEFGQDGIRETVQQNKHLDGGTIARAIIAESSKYIMSNAKDDRTIIVAEMLS